MRGPSVSPGGGIVKVMLDADVKTCTVKTRSSFKFIDDEDQSILATGEQADIALGTIEGGVEIGGRPFKSSSIRLMTDEPWVYGKLPYRGRLLIKRQKDGRLLLINELSIEEYLYGVVPREMASSAPMEALKAQAVAARTYAYSRMMRNGTTYDVDTTALTQVYGGVSAETASCVKAVNETRDYVLTFQNRMAQTPYHANSGGKTEDVVNIWGYASPYLKGTDVPFCSWSPNYRWSASIGWEKLEAALNKEGVPAKGLKGIEVADRYWSDRVKSLRVLVDGKWKMVSVGEFRKALGGQLLRSTNFSVKARDQKLYFEGLGWGHGVGMDQDGAVGMAREGYTYEDILKKFYEGTVLKKIIGGS